MNTILKWLILNRVWPMPPLTLFIFILLTISPASAESLHQKLAVDIVKSLLRKAQDPATQTKSWQELLGATLEETLTLEAQQELRTFGAQRSQKFLDQLNGSWGTRTLNRNLKGPLYEKMSQEAAVQGRAHLEQFVEELNGALKSKDELLAYIEKRGWVRRDIISSEELQTLSSLQTRFEPELANIAGKRALRTLDELRQFHLRKNFEALRVQASRPVAALSEQLILVFRNLSEGHQYLWTSGEARFALRLAWGIRYYLTYFRLWNRWQAVIRVPKYLPQSDAEFASLLANITQQISRTVVFTPPGFLRYALRPGAFVERAIDQQARAMAAEFEGLKNLNTLSSELAETVARLAKEEASFLRLEALLQEQGFETFLTTFCTNEKPLEEALSRRLGILYGGYGIIPFRDRGTYFRAWLGRTLMAGIFVSMTAQQMHGAAQEDPKPHWRDPNQTFPGDHPTQLSERGGEAPRTLKLYEMADVMTQLLIQDKQRELEFYQSEHETLSKQLLLEADEKERSTLQAQLLEMEEKMKAVQQTLDEIYQHLQTHFSTD
ncbi:MAG: hypothetical protein HY390_04475 [Deltaproteobacteria bacterium]|nr:hypothetical protein [Deltaproteobacteria bacterium]